jgi:hypothetical protein
MPDDPKDILNRFGEQCVRLKLDHDLFTVLFFGGQQQTDLLQQTAPLTFVALYNMMRNSLFLQFCRITDKAGDGSRTNLTTNSLLTLISWPPEVLAKLQATNQRMMKFRKLVEPARSKRIAHADLRAELDQVTLGKFPPEADLKFLNDLEEFLSTAHEHVIGSPVSLSIGGSDDVHLLICALTKARLYDTCAKCTATERTEAVLDYGNNCF